MENEIQNTPKRTFIFQKDFLNYKIGDKLVTDEQGTIHLKYHDVEVSLPMNSKILKEFHEDPIKNPKNNSFTILSFMDNEKKFILSFRNNNSHYPYFNQEHFTHNSLDYCLKNNYSIQSVRRESDGEIFSIGDALKFGTYDGYVNILSMSINNFGVFVFTCTAKWATQLSQASKFDNQTLKSVIGYSDEDKLYFDGKSEPIHVMEKSYVVLGKNIFFSVVQSFPKDDKAKKFKTHKAAQDYLQVQKDVKESRMTIGARIYPKERRMVYDVLRKETGITSDADNKHIFLIKGFNFFEGKTFVVFSANQSHLLAQPIEWFALNFGQQHVGLKCNSDRTDVLVMIGSVRTTYTELKQFHKLLVDLNRFSLKSHIIKINDRSPSFDESTVISFGEHQGPLEDVYKIIARCERILK
jgi:hypothetical protein